LIIFQLSSIFGTAYRGNFGIGRCNPCRGWYL